MLSILDYYRSHIQNRNRIGRILLRLIQLGSFLTQVLSSDGVESPNREVNEEYVI